MVTMITMVIRTWDPKVLSLLQVAFLRELRKNELVALITEAVGIRV
jgi:hypothetical protein